MKHALLVAAVLFAPASAWAQVPDCDGHDPDGAAEAFEEGNRLLGEAIDHAGHRRLDRARELAESALSYFDRQCELGDSSALAERGAALMLMGEAMRSAESYDAYLREHPLTSLDARTRRRIEANLQPGRLTVAFFSDDETGAHLFVDGLDFGPLPRETPVRLPAGEHVLEARDRSGRALVDATAVVSDGEAAITLTVPTISIETEPEPEPEPERVVEREPERVPDPGPRVDYLPFEIATGAATGVFLLLGIGLQVGADDRAQTFNRFCLDPSMPYSGCDSVRSEYDGLFGAAVTSYVLAGLAAAGLVTVIVLDVTQPVSREPMRVGFGPGGVSVAGGF